MHCIKKKSKKIRIGEGNPTFIVAEISANHGKSFKRAIELIKTAQRAGADAVKFQTYTPATLTLDVDNKYFRIKHPKWGGQTLYQLYRKSYTPWNWFKKLKKVAEDSGIIFFSTAFDKTSVDFLEELDVSIHKISSFELVDLSLIEYTAKTQKPLILSTGMATISEIEEAVKTAIKAGAKDVILLKCVSSYPAMPEEMNLCTIPHMKKKFSLPIGLSDHTLGIGVAIAAVSLGANIIEKHFTLSRNLRTPDSFYSIEPQELKELVENIRFVEKSLGKVHYGLTSGERESRIFRRSLFVVENIKAGEIFAERNVRSVRPGYGLPPKYLKNILGKNARKNIRKGIPLNWNLIKKKPGQKR